MPSDYSDEHIRQMTDPRHDQSAFSLICKKNKIFSLSASECEWAELNGRKTWEHLSLTLIHIS